MKIFISQPMSDRTEKEILRERQFIKDLIIFTYGLNVHFIESFFEEETLDDPIIMLGKSIQLMYDADMIVFAENYTSARGCRIENMVAKEYGIKRAIVHRHKNGDIQIIEEN